MGIFKRRSAVGVCVPLFIFVALLLISARMQAASWNLGDVFVAAASGGYKLLDSGGTLKDSLPAAAPGGSANGCALDSSLNLWTVNGGNNQILKFPFQSSSIAPGFPLSTSPLTSPQAIVFAGDGSFYVGFAGGTIQKYNNSSGAPQGPPITSLQIDTTTAFRMDLAADQKTMFYSSGGQNIWTVDVSNGTANNLFATFAPPNGPLYKSYALRVLSPTSAVSAPLAGPGSRIGGLVVAHGANIILVNPFGNAVRTYDAAAGSQNQDNWFALALDPNDVTVADRGFWAGDRVTGRLWHFRVGPLSGGASASGPDAGPFFNSSPIGGLCVNGEPTQAQYTRILEFAPGTDVAQVAAFNHQLESGPTFSPEEHRVAVTFASLVEPTRVAVSAREAISDGVPTYLPPSLTTLDSRDVDSGFVANFWGDPESPVGVRYVHGRAVYYRAEALTPGAPHHSVKISSVKNFNDLIAGKTCQVGLTAVPRALRVLHDPGSDDNLSDGYQFATDLTAFFGIDEWEVGTDQGGSRWMAVFRCATGTSTLTRPANNRTFNLGQSLVIELNLFDAAGNPIQNAIGGPHHIAVVVGVKNSNGTFIRTFGFNGLDFFQQLQPGIYRGNLNLAAPDFQKNQTYVLSVSDFNDANNADLPLYPQQYVTFSIK